MVCLKASCSTHENNLKLAHLLLPVRHVTWNNLQKLHRHLECLGSKRTLLEKIVSAKREVSCSELFTKFNIHPLAIDFGIETVMDSIRKISN
jgi:hypothetical protein